jgi:hypothetical protein
MPVTAPPVTRNDDQSVLGVSFETVHHPDSSPVLAPISTEGRAMLLPWPRSKEDVMKPNRRPQQFDPSTQPLSLRNIEDLNWQWEMQQAHPAIARRAYELFETRGCEHGHDWEDWFRAESELHLNE